MRSPRTVGITAAAQFCSISPALLRYRALSHHIRVWRWKPLRFRLSDVLEARERMQIKDPRGRKPGNTKLDQLLQEIAS